jgi:hypothetical protein
MLKQVGEYEPFGKRFLKEQSHLVQKQSKGPILFSFLKEPEYPCFHKLFSLSDDSTMDIGSRTDVKKLPLDNSSIIGDGKTKLDNPAFSLEQEVYVDNSTVIWSKGNHIITSFTYKDQLQSIQQVLFAWFPVKHAFYDDDPTRINSVTLDLDPQDPSFEEQQQQQQLNESSSSVPVNTNRNTQDTDNNGKTLRRGLCIVFQTFIEVHYTNGLSTTIHSPFSINNVAALDCGLLVTRKEPVRVERRSSKKEMHEPSISPYENVNFMMVTNIQLTYPVITTGMETYTNRSGSSTLYHQPPTHTILYASTNPDLPLVVTFNSDNKHFIWCFERARTMGSKKGQKTNPGEAKLRFLWKETAQRYVK